MGRGARRHRPSLLCKWTALRLRKGGRERSKRVLRPGRHRGATAPPSPPERAAASTATGCIWRSAPRRTFRSRGPSRLAASERIARPSPRCSTSSRPRVRPGGRTRWTKGYDLDRIVYDECPGRGTSAGDPACGKRRESSGVRTTRRLASTERAVRRTRTRNGTQLQVALPYRRVQAHVCLGQGRPTAHTHTSLHFAVEGSLPWPCIRRESFRQAQDEWALAPARVRKIERVRASRRPHDPLSVDLCSESGASGDGPSGGIGSLASI